MPDHPSNNSAVGNSRGGRPQEDDGDDDGDDAAVVADAAVGWRSSWWPLPLPDWTYYFVPPPLTPFNDADDDKNDNDDTIVIAIPGFLRPFLGLDGLPVAATSSSSSTSVCGGRYYSDDVEQQDDGGSDEGNGDGGGGRRRGEGRGNSNMMMASDFAVTPAPASTVGDEPQQPCSFHDGGGRIRGHTVGSTNPWKTGTEPDAAAAEAAAKHDVDVGTSYSSSTSSVDGLVCSTAPSSSSSSPRLDSAGKARRQPLLWKKKKMWHSLRILPSLSSSSWSPSKAASTQAVPTKEHRDEVLSASASSRPLTGLSSFVASSFPTPRRQRHRIHSSDDDPRSLVDDLRPQREQQLRGIQRQINQGHERVRQMEREVATAHKKVVQLQEALRTERASWKEQLAAVAQAKTEVAEWQAQADALQRNLSDDGPVRRRRSYTADAAHQRQRQIQPGPLEKCASETGLRNPEVVPERPLNDVADPLSFDRDETTTSMPPARRRASTDSKLVRKTSLAAFMRVSDLAVDGPPPTNHDNVMDGNDSFSSFTNGYDENDDSNNNNNNNNNNNQRSADFYWLDENFGMVLDRLWKLGWEHATDESSGRFQFVGSGGRGSNSHQLGPHNCVVRNSDGDSSGWPVRPWHEPLSTNVLLWVGSCLPSEDGSRHHHGHDWPIVKVRGLVCATPRQVAELLLDSSQVHVYNKMSAERHDVVVVQESVDMNADDSLYGFAGLAKVTRSILKPRLLPKPIETVALWHAKPLTCYAAPSNDAVGYMIVTRSVWDGTTVPSPNGGGHNVPSSTSSVLRSEMLLGVHLCRPIGCVGTASSNKVICELTSVTHVVPTGVPEYLAKKMAPSTAVSTLESIQSHFAAK